MINNIWTMISSTAAALSAIFSLIGLCVNVHYNKKMYRANLNIKKKLDILDSIKELVTEYLSAVEYLCYLYDKARANENDNKKGINFDDYSRQMGKTKDIKNKLEMSLSFIKSPALERDLNIIWSVLPDLGKYFNGSTNSYLSDKEKIFNENFAKLSKMMKKDCADFYKDEFNKLVK